MTIFAIIPVDEKDRETLGQILNQDEYADSAFPLPSGDWLIDFNGTTGKLMDALGIGPDYGALVIRFSKYYGGYASSELWEWLEEHDD